MVGTCHYFWALEMGSKAGWELKKIGKDATKPLLDLLTDYEKGKEKGIIAHYILSNIWMDTLLSWSSFEHFGRDRSIHYGYNGLNFYERDDKWFVLYRDLDAAKERWLKLLKEKNFLFSP